MTKTVTNNYKKAVFYQVYLLHPLLVVAVTPVVGRQRQQARNPPPGFRLAGAQDV